MIDYCISLESLFLSGKRPSLVSNHLAKADRKRFYRELTSLMENYELSEVAISRLKERVAATEHVGNVDRIQSELTQLGFPVTSDDVKTVVNQRGAVVHAGDTLDPTQVKTAAALAREWVRQALLRYLSDSSHAP